MNVELIKPILKSIIADTKELTKLTRNREAAQQKRFTILGYLQGIEFNTKRLRKLVSHHSE